MDDLIQLLHEGKHSLVVANGEVCTFNGRGVIDLYHLLQDDPGFLYEASIADKVVGKAAAALLALAKVKEVYADVVSRPALDLLSKTDIKISYGVVAPHIINRTATGWCPLETRCFDCATPEECFHQIEAFYRQIND